MAQALNGQLRDFSLPDVLQFILQQRKSGRLTLTFHHQRAEVGISRGNVSHIDVDGRNVETVIRDWLLSCGRMNSEELSGVESVSRSMDRSILETLVAKKFINAEERAEWIGIVAEDLVCDLFQWQEGAYEFNTDLPATSVRGVGINLSTEMISMEGMRRLDEWPRLRDRLGSPNVQISLSQMPASLSELGPESIVLRQLELASAPLNLEELERRVPFGKFRLYDTVVSYADAGYITLRQDGKSFESGIHMPDETDSSRTSSTAFLLVGGALLLVVALLFNWSAGAAIGHLASVPERGFIGAESRFESMKLHTSILRHRFLSGNWPTSLSKASNGLELSRGERGSTLGVEYGYKATPEGYSLWLRDPSPDRMKTKP
ncbi:MAG: DUF4388 domain-containing protein [Fibrobacteres bacterium]|nr:DUF4388 domain-containing protein [Fibrobacterota bacterium]